MKNWMNLLFLGFLLLDGCAFRPLYTPQVVQNVCVTPVPEESGHQLYLSLQQHFSNTASCSYTLVVQAPVYSFSDQSISDKDFITMQSILASAEYSLKNAKKEVVLHNRTTTTGSSAIVQNPYSSVVAEEKTIRDLNQILANQIALHVSAFLDGQSK